MNDDDDLLGSALGPSQCSIWLWHSQVVSKQSVNREPSNKNTSPHKLRPKEINTKKQRPFLTIMTHSFSDWNHASSQSHCTSRGSRPVVVNTIVNMAFFLPMAPLKGLANECRKWQKRVIKPDDIILFATTKDNKTLFEPSDLRLQFQAFDRKVLLAWLQEYLFSNVPRKEWRG